MVRWSRLGGLSALIAIGCASSAAHIGNNFTTYLIGGLVDRYGFSPVQMGAFAMAETLAYACALFLAAPRVARLSARTIAMAASSMVVAGQGICLFTGFYPFLLASRLVAGFGFGLMNCAVNLAAGPVCRAIVADRRSWPAPLPRPSLAVAGTPYVRPLCVHQVPAQMPMRARPNGLIPK